ncbi:unnamed protein product [Linum trigynum]|uniref:Uncharacterized protein n=1 Tax=Linum trigynum TaxID=586398 RepID=A0AAV2FEM0_9ROSI
MEGSDPHADLAHAQFQALVASFRAQKELADILARLGSEQTKVIQLQGQAAGTERRVSSIQNNCDDALAHVAELARKLTEDLNAEREKTRSEERVRIRAELSHEFEEEKKLLEKEFDRVREDVAAEKEELNKKLEEFEQKETAEKVAIAAKTIQTYKQSSAFGKHLSDYMYPTIVAVCKKVRPGNPGSRWNTRDMVRHVQQFFKENRSLSDDSESETEEEGVVVVGSGGNHPKPIVFTFSFSFVLSDTELAVHHCNILGRIPLLF